jgi:hypothetical protein
LRMALLGLSSAVEISGNEVRTVNPEHLPSLARMVNGILQNLCVRCAMAMTLLMDLRLAIDPNLLNPHQGSFTSGLPVSEYGSTFIKVPAVWFACAPSTAQ